MTVINVAEEKKKNDKRINQETSDFVIKISSIVTSETNGYYRATPGKKVSIQFDILDGGSKRNDIDQLNLVVPLNKLIDGKKVDEMYLDVEIIQGEFLISGTFTLPGNWVLVFDQVNESLKSISSDWKLSGDNIVFKV